MKKFMLMFLLLPMFTLGQSDKVKELDIELKNLQYPFEVKSLMLPVQNQELRMAYMDETPANYNQQNIVLLHGKNFNGSYWETTMRELLQSGYRVIVPDQVGFGKSSKPATFQYSFQQLATNTKTLLDSLKIERAVILGHSMGGMLATRFALMYPQATQKLVLENPIGLEDYKQLSPYQSLDKNYKNELTQNYEKIKQYQLTNYYDGKWKPEYDPWVNMLAGWTLNKDYPIIAWNAALTSDMIFTQPVVHEFKNISSPTLLIIGTRDRTAIGKTFVPEDVRKTMGLYNELGKLTQKKIPDSKLVELEDVGHLPHIESFDLFIKALKKFCSKALNWVGLSSCIQWLAPSID
ncbi:MAG: alpha/beta hydrolase [Gloeobacteraceae cyanobacterium ES-bin-316]|nr:alpha/beta hydrolase [Ferruginibacter sp.]